MKTYIANDPNPPLQDETKHRVLQYFSLYNTYDTSWTTFLEQQNIKHMYDLIGSRSTLATPSQKKLGRQIEYYRRKLRTDSGFCKVFLFFDVGCLFRTTQWVYPLDPLLDPLLLVLTMAGHDID